MACELSASMVLQQESLYGLSLLCIKEYIQAVVDENVVIILVLHWEEGAAIQQVTVSLSHHHYHCQSLKNKPFWCFPMMVMVQLRMLTLSQALEKGFMITEWVLLGNKKRVFFQQQVKGNSSFLQQTNSKPGVT
mmetsp:Transcript_37982/g.55706  ORF Transcript_37982/g.55706 Transcript_37982/m.55706 type:complete len:134 (+) Transcript_37982:447-848(+)